MNHKDKVRQSGKQKNGSSKFWTYLIMFLCGLTIVAGFFLAGRQHFSSMDTGMKNSRLRKQVDELEAEKRRLLLAREVSLSPTEIKKAAKKSGLIGQYSVDVEPAIASSASMSKDKMGSGVAFETKTMLAKTVAVAPVLKTSTTTFSKIPKIPSQERKPLSNE